MALNVLHRADPNAVAFLDGRLLTFARTGARERRAAVAEES